GKVGGGCCRRRDRVEDSYEGWRGGAGGRSGLSYRTTGGHDSAALMGGGAAMRPSDRLAKSELIWMWTQMLRIREFEERVKRTFVEHPGVIRGHTHLGDGAEASIIGALA